MLNRFSSRKTDLGNFLTERLEDAVSYDRIAGYFRSSVLEIAGEELSNIQGKIRILCNSDITKEDVEIAEMAAARMKQEWCESAPEDDFDSPDTCERLHRLYQLLVSGKMEIRVLPDSVYGFIHGKAGVITYKDGTKTCFMGSMNETGTALKTNYEIVWEDTSIQGVQWVQHEFDYFWENRYAVPLADFVVQDIERISKRHIVPVDEWRKDKNAKPEVAAVEEPIFRKEFGLWAHQKYFVSRAFSEHKTQGGARLLLADQVGLGKTVQLAMSAKLMALYGELPILIIVPKTLLYQWQDEIYSLLNMPSAVWTGKCWRDENGFDYICDSVRGIQRCPRRIGIVSQGLITAKTEAAELLKQMKYECVILDEAHRARRKNLSDDANHKKARPNNLLAFLQEITFRTHSMLLATATPVQINPIEAFDLLEALGLPKSAWKIMGDSYSVWRKTPQTGLNYVAGEEKIPATDGLMWSLMRNPLPQANDNVRQVEILRQQLDLTENDDVLPQDAFEGYPPFLKDKIRDLYSDQDFVETLNPYIRNIVRRTRDYLEKTINPQTGDPYLKKINVQLLGEGEDGALKLQGYMRQAYETAQEFSTMLSKRVKGGGFMSTLVLKRIGSTMIAGERTAEKLMSWTYTSEDTEEDTTYFDADEDMDESGSMSDQDTKKVQSEMKQLTTEEKACLEKLIAVLHSNRDTDPKYLRVRDILKNGADNDGGWLEKGCIIFSQYFDSAQYVAELLSKDFKKEPIGLYAGGDRSGIYQDGLYTKRDKDTLKKMVRTHELRVLVGTDAASEGLNLQSLSTLINLDLPWNPTRLEQRKGRIQRIGQMADTIQIYNMRYKDSVEDRVHEKLSDRLQAVFNLFGQIPEVLEDVWVAIAQNDEQKALEAINKVPKKNPFIMKYETGIPNSDNWEVCANVLDKQEKYRTLMNGWK